MKFKTLTGSEKRVSKPKKYLISWDQESKSKIQFAAKQFLKEYWENHVVFEEFPIAGTRLSFDFYNANKKIAVEVQGAQHTKYVPFFHGRKSQFISQLRRDQQKIDFCALNNIKLVEIFHDEKINKKIFEKNGVNL
tara:strand:- start:33189 stop:33596 length:408 start_codon:yes stop_codon:yes gene_type:complete